jgi:hypothetical protein
MNIAAVYAEVARRLQRVVKDTYSTPPAQPVYPSAILAIPNVETFHSDFAHSLCHLTTTVRMVAGHGDSDSALKLILQWMSTDTPNSVERALTDKTDAPDPPPFARLVVQSAGDLRQEGDSLGVTFNLSIDA